MSNNNNEIMNERDLMQNEWNFSWEHIRGVSTTYWKLFLAIIALNGSIGIYYLGKCINDLCIFDGIASIVLLVINLLIIIIYQREHVSKHENYLQIWKIRKEVFTNSTTKINWHNFIDEKKPSMKGSGFLLYMILKLIIGIIVPVFILCSYLYNCLTYYQIILIFFFIFMLIGTIMIVCVCCGPISKINNDIKTIKEDIRNINNNK